MNKKTELLTPVRIAMTIGLVIFMISLQVGRGNSRASMEDVAASVTQAIDVSAMEESSNQMFKRFYGLNAADYEAVLLYAPVTNMDAKELLIVKLKDQAQSDTVKAACEKRIETQKASFDGYGVEQFDLLEHHILDIQGNYVLLVVHPDAAAADQAFRKSL